MNFVLISLLMKRGALRAGATHMHILARCSHSCPQMIILFNKNTHTLTYICEYIHALTASSVRFILCVTDMTNCTFPASHLTQRRCQNAAAAAARYASAAHAAGTTPDTAAATTDAARAAATTLNTTNCFISSNT